MRLKSLALNPYVHMSVLATIALMTFSRTLGSYFLADDFGEITYVSQIAAGNMGMLWANFTGNFMQIPSMAVWRPWLLVSLLTDFLIWGAKPFGYYLTNLLSYMATCLLFYALISNLTSNWCKTRSGLAAFFSSLIFVLNPLHCESISWVVGRVDIVCALFYLACLNLFILSMRAFNRGAQGHYKKLTILSVVCFWLAMWTKEMAIGLPVLVSAIALLWGEPALGIKKSLQLSLPLWVSTLVYFVLRYLALGTLTGGYTQGIGDAQAANALSHWLDPDTARRLFFPMAYSIYYSNGGGEHIFAKLLSCIYSLLATLFLLRLVSLSLPLRWVIFTPIWIATALAPIYKLWGLGYELEGARFVFFLTMPLAALAPILLFAPHTSGTATKGPWEQKLRPAFALLTILSLCTMCFVFYKLASRLNLEWVHAGKEVREFAEKSRTLGASPGQGPILVLGIPKRHGGAHMVLNGTTFKILLQPPFTQTALGSHFVTFDPIIFGNADYINASRFKDCLALPGAQLVVWRSDKADFEQLNLGPSNKPLPELVLPIAGQKGLLHTLGHETMEHKTSTSAITNITAGDGICFDGLDLNPLDADFLQVHLTCLNAWNQPPGNKPLKLTCSWDDRDEHCQVSKDFIAEGKDDGEQVVTLRLSDNWHWYSGSSTESGSASASANGHSDGKKIGSLFIELPPGCNLNIWSVKLAKVSDLCPSVSILKDCYKSLSSTGVYQVASGKPVDLSISGAASQGASKVRLEVSKPNAFFENLNEADQSSALSSKVDLQTSPDLHYCLPPPKNGANYEIRARLMGPKGEILGESSDPIVVRVE